MVGSRPMGAARMAAPLRSLPGVIWASRSAPVELDPSRAWKRLEYPTLGSRWNPWTNFAASVAGDHSSPESRSSAMAIVIWVSSV